MRRRHLLLIVFFFNDTATTEIYTLSLHDALPIYRLSLAAQRLVSAVVLRCDEEERQRRGTDRRWLRSEEHTSELQSHLNLVCRLLLEKKNKRNYEHEYQCEPAPNHRSVSAESAIP